MKVAVYSVRTAAGASATNPTLLQILAFSCKNLQYPNSQLEANVKISTNPDTEFTKNKKKAIKRNNGYCLNCPKIEDWKCPCKEFRERTTSGWCGEGLYYLDIEGEESNV